MVTGLKRLGRMAAEDGMRLCYHHHMATGVMFRPEVDRLMNDTDPELVHLLLDTGHLYWAGDDPLDMTKAYADRIKHVHLKDIRDEVLSAAPSNASASSSR
jgi:inosose dehydratase